MPTSSRVGYDCTVQAPLEGKKLAVLGEGWQVLEKGGGAPRFTQLCAEWTAAGNVGHTGGLRGLTVTLIASCRLSGELYISTTSVLNFGILHSPIGSCSSSFSVSFWLSINCAFPFTSLSFDH